MMDKAKGVRVVEDDSLKENIVELLSMPEPGDVEFVFPKLNIALYQPKHFYNELLKGATPRNLKAPHKETKWAREGESVGRELT